MKQITEILNHDILWHVDSKAVKQLTEVDIEHISDLIHEGIKQGELIVYYGKAGRFTAVGWWQIINWRDIACQLFNACPSETKEQKEARKRFDENWKF